MARWIDRYAKWVLNWTNWYRNGRSIRGYDLWSWSTAILANTCPCVWYIGKWFEEAFVLGCQKSLTLLSVVLSLVNIKARYGRSDKSFTSLIQVVQDMLPEENTLPKSYYQAKILCLMGMEYQKIHVFLNDCILYRQEYEEMHKCLMCKVSRYKVKDDDKWWNDNKRPPRKCYGIFQSFQGSSVCLLMQMTQKILHGM